ncbi:uncharacterized protein ZBAI_04499 [Zygosaccharomyces bailii ISA1307]|nr:uncharacterized protein ZBAI_04499 [Zygosaccharomyces bailii ISA1307]
MHNVITPTKFGIGVTSSFFYAAGLVSEGIIESIHDLLHIILLKNGIVKGDTLHLTATQYGTIASGMSKENFRVAYENPQNISTPRHKSATQTRDTKLSHSFQQATRNHWIAEAKSSRPNTSPEKSFSAGESAPQHRLAVCPACSVPWF